MKASRKTDGRPRATAGGRRAAAASVEPAVTLRLPPRAGPVQRRLSTAPWRGQVAAASRDCATCLATCGRLPAPLRAVCIRLCRDACGR